jgi:hypothetical protein
VKLISVDFGREIVVLGVVGALPLWDETSHQVPTGGGCSKAGVLSTGTIDLPGQACSSLFKGTVHQFASISLSLQQSNSTHVHQSLTSILPYMCILLSSHYGMIAGTTMDLDSCVS